MSDVLFSLWLALQDAEPPDDDDEDDDDDEGGGLPAPVAPQPERPTPTADRRPWPPRIRLFLPPELAPVPVPVTAGAC